MRKLLAVAVCVMAAAGLLSPAKADVEFFFDNRSPVEARGIVVETETGKTHTIYLRSPQKQDITIDAQWKGVACPLDCSRINRDNRLRFTHIANSDDIYCEVKWTYGEIRDGGIIDIQFVISYTAPGRTCTVQGLTTLPVSGSNATAWFEIALTQ